jgi:diketogulonate reductase-like aldo/keto reductase
VKRTVGFSKPKPRNHSFPEPPDSLPAAFFVSTRFSPLLEPVEQSLEPIVKLKKQGKIRHIGLSEVKPKDIDHARRIVEIISVQNLCNVSDRRMKTFSNAANGTISPSFPGSRSQPVCSRNPAAS